MWRNILTAVQKSCDFVEICVIVCTFVCLFEMIVL